MYDAEKNQEARVLWEGQAVMHFAFGGDMLAFMVLGSVLLFMLCDWFLFSAGFWANPNPLYFLLTLPGLYFLLTPLRFWLMTGFTHYCMTDSAFIIIEDYFFFSRKYTLSFSEVSRITVDVKTEYVIFYLGLYKRWWNVKNSASDFSFYVSTFELESFLAYLPPEKLFHYVKKSAWHWDYLPYPAPAFTGKRAPEGLTAPAGERTDN